MTSFATNASRSEPVVGRRERNPVWHTRIMRFFNTTGPVRLDKHQPSPPPCLRPSGHVSERLAMLA